MNRPPIIDQTRPDQTRPDQTRPDQVYCLLNYIDTTKIEWLYVLLMMIAGITLVFLTPIYQIPDETNHFARAWQISEGVFISPIHEHDDRKNFVSFVPSVFLQEKYTYNLFVGKSRYSFGDITEFLAEPLDDVLDMHTINNTGPYTPVVYFPQALAAYVMRSFGGTAGQIYYAMRLGAVLFSILCVFIALRLLPEKKMLIFLIAMMPMYLAESASISADAVVYGGCMIVSAYILSLTRDETTLTLRQIFTLIVMAIIIGLLKQVYGTILLMYFLIPYKRLGNKRNYFLCGALILGICLASSFIWMYFSVTRYKFNLALFKGMDIAEQMKFIAEAPLRFLKIFITSNIFDMRFYVVSFIGILGWLQVGIPLWFKIVYVLLLIAGAVFSQLSLRNWHRVLMIGGFIASLIAIDFFEYFTFNFVGSLRIGGVQGRYFIPIALMLLSSFSCLPRLKHEKAIALFAGIVSVITTLTVTYRHFYA